MSMEKIYRVGIGGSPVEEYGDTPFPDPDSVAFDASGAISGTPGSVLVGNGGEPGYIAAILPDQSTITPIGPTFNIGNPAVLKFDKTGRLLVADQAPPFRALAITRTEIVELGDSFLAIAVDGSNRVYSAFLKNQIKVIASDGTPLPDLTPIDNSRDYFSNLEFGPFDEIWKGHLFATSEDSNIYRILSDGTIIKFGSGLTADNRSGLAFGPDGALYISDWNADAIYRITPSENTPPLASCQDVTVSTAPGLCSADASIDDSSFDPDGDPITLDQEPEGPYGLGDTEVTLTVTDDKGASDTCNATVKVIDQEPPVISSVTASPNELWPPNHKMVPVTVAVAVSDICDPEPVCLITEVASNEPVNGLGDGNTAPDWEITGGLTVNLRAERSGKGSGRVYTITVECTDQSKNSSTDTETVTVPHDKGKKKNQNNKKKK
jgi:hypothetical protein